ncbi:T-box transcription factor Ci-mT [Ciona intestinalis]
MAFSEVQYPAQHCAVGGQQFQGSLQYFGSMAPNYAGMSQQHKQWPSNQDFNANENYQSHNFMQQMQPRPSPNGQNQMWNANQRCDANVYNPHHLAPMINNVSYPQQHGFNRQRVNSAASDGCPTPQPNHWMAAQQSPTMWSPSGMSDPSRSRQPSLTDGGPHTPDNYYQTQNHQYQINQQQRSNHPYQPNYHVGPPAGVSGSYMRTLSPTSSIPNSPPLLPMLTSHSMQPNPIMMSHRQPQQPVNNQIQTPIGPSTSKVSGSDWELECMGVKIKLASAELWKHFENVTTEMVISKHGRRMFPVLEYDVSGLNPGKLYNFFVDFVLANDYVWKYMDQKWQATGLASAEEPGFHPGQRVYIHHESPALGDFWNKKGAGFGKMKLSNHLHDEKEKIITLRTLHKYQPRLHIVEVDHRNPTLQSNLRTFVLPKTTFMTVTLYHDTDVAQLKINLNPFARSFRSSCPKPVDTGNSSSNSSSMSQTSSPLTSSDDADTSAIPEWTETDPVGHNPSQIVKIENPVQGIDIEKAKKFLNKQLSVMSQLVQKSEELERNSSSNKNQEAKPRQVIKIPDPNDDEAPGESLEELLKPQTVHHFPPQSSEVKPPSENKKNPTSAATSLADYQLLNVDRCFPPNAVAPPSEALPFDPNQLRRSHQKEQGQSENLPTFFDCTYYREQAGASKINNETKQDPSSTNTPHLPVIYVPSSTNHQSTSNDVITVASPSQAPTITSQSTPITHASPTRSEGTLFPTLPTLSPNCLRDMLLGEVSADNFASSSSKRKHHDDDDEEDDDVFFNSPGDFDFLSAQPNKRGCYYGA